MPLATSTMSTYTIGGAGTVGALPVGSTNLYACAYDTSAASLCQNISVTVKGPSSSFNITDAFSAVDVATLAKTKDVSALAAGALAIANLASYGAKDGPIDSTQAEALEMKASCLISSLNSTADVRDPEAMRQVVGAVVGLASVLTNASDDVRSSVADIATSGVKAATTSKQPISGDGASQLISLLAFGAPRSRSTQSRRLQALLDPATIVANVDALAKVLLAGAVPGSGYVASGSDGMYISTAAQMGSTVESLAIQVR